MISSCSSSHVSSAADLLLEWKKNMLLHLTFQPEHDVTSSSKSWFTHLALQDYGYMLEELIHDMTG